MTELHDLVTQLTEPHTVPVHRHGLLVGHRDQAGLIRILANARTANIGAGNGNKAAHERLTLNTTASELHTTIQKRVRAWAITVDVPRHWHLTTGNPIDWTDPTQLLRAWHTRIQADPHLDERPYLTTLHNWIRTITDLCIDPPRRWTIQAPCPLCGQRYTLDPDGHQIDTLGVIERDPANESQVICRNCEAVWNGINGSRQLRIQIDDATRIAS